MPRRRDAFHFWAMPLVAAFGPIKSEGLSPDRGHSPGTIWLLSAGHSHRGTSGGKAQHNIAHHFRGKAAPTISEYQT
jgi:hypothetical protein